MPTIRLEGNRVLYSQNPQYIAERFRIEVSNEGSIICKDDQEITLIAFVNYEQFTQYLNRLFGFKFTNFGCLEFSQTINEFSTQQYNMLKSTLTLMHWFHLALSFPQAINFEEMSYGEFVLEKDLSDGSKNDLYIPGKEIQKEIEPLERLKEINLLFHFIAVDQNGKQFQQYCTPLIKVNNRIDLFNYGQSGKSALPIWDRIIKDRDNAIRKWARGGK
jgi:hypothetical protein